MRARVRGRRAWVLAVVLLATFAVNLTLTILGIAIKTIADEFGASTGDTAWITLGPIVLATLLTPPAGRIADRFGRRRIWLVGFAITIAGMAFSAVAWSLPALIAARLLTGFGTAWVLPSGLAMATSHYPPEARSTPIGYWTATVAFAPALGIVGGVVVEWLSWRWLFAMQLPLALLAWLLAFVVFDEQRIETKGRFDTMGTVLAAAAVTTLLLGVNQAPKWGWTSAPVLACIAVAVTATALFVRTEQRADNPIVPLRLFLERAIANGMTSRFVVNAAYMGSFIVMPLFLGDIWGWDVALVSFALLPRPIAMGITGPFIPRLTSRLGEGALTVGGSSLVAAALVVLALLPDQPNYPLLLLALVLQGVGLGLSSSAIGTVVTSRSPRELLGPAASVLSLTSQLANSTGIAVFLSLVEVGGGETVAGSYTFTLATGAAITVVGVVTAVRMARALRRGGPIVPATAAIAASAGGGPVT